MEKRTRIVLIGSVLGFIAIISLISYLVFINQKQNEPQIITENTNVPVSNRSNEELTRAIIEQVPSLSNNGQSTFTIGNVNKLQERWYVITLYLKDDTQKSNPAKILLYDSPREQALEVTIGPGTSFPEDQIQSLGIPEPVAAELNK